MKMKTKAVFAALLIILLLQGCGLKGDLYLSEDEESSAPAEAAAKTGPETDSDSEDRKNAKQEITGPD
jgi:predicted small lipoprotein YifL